MEKEKFILDGSKVLWHQERIKEWNYGGGGLLPLPLTVH